MQKVWRSCTLGLAAVASFFGLTLAAQSGDLATIQQRLNSQFKLTTITADRSDIVTAGDVVVINRPGLLMYAVASPLPPSNSYKNGKIGQGWGGFGKDMMIGMAAPGGATAASYSHRTFVPEEKCWVTGIQVQKDGILFQLYSDPYDDTRYYANLKIPFPDKKTVPPADVALQAVAEVLAPVRQDTQADQSQQPAPIPPPPGISGKYRSQKNGAELIFVSGSSVILLVPGANQNRGQYTLSGEALSVKFPIGGPIQFQVQGSTLVSDKGVVWDREGGPPAQDVAVAPVSAPASADPAPASMPDIAPPPPPADAPPPTIALGQTVDQVTAGFGQPAREAKLGAKVIFYYKDMKVTFTGGKVTDVE